jgi:hypothetical protein
MWRSTQLQVGCRGWPRHTCRLASSNREEFALRTILELGRGRENGSDHGLVIRKWSAEYRRVAGFQILMERKSSLLRSFGPSERVRSVDCLAG